MKRLLLILFMTLSASFAVSAGAQGIDPEKDSVAVQQMREHMAKIRRYRPTVALVLSGGGAKGASHVGVIRYLEELDSCGSGTWNQHGRTYRWPLFVGIQY